MGHRTIFCALAGAAMISSTAVLAQHGPGGGGGPPAGVPGGGMGNAGGMGNMGMGRLDMPGSMLGAAGIGVQTRDQARMNSQGSIHASDTAKAHANPNSAIFTTTTGTQLTFTTGMAVYNPGNAQIGTVQRIVTNGQGVVTRVFIKDAAGRTYSLSPTSFTLVGSNLTTSATLRG